MRQLALSVLLGAAAMFAGAAQAQDAPALSGAEAYPFTPAANTAPAEAPWDGNSRREFDTTSRSPFQVGFNALDAGDVARAETFFSGIVQRKPKDAEANFYLGATRMDLGEWAAAQRHLEFAAKKITGHPDPKSRLGVTYAMLGNAAGAEAQRAELVKMAKACKETCRLSPYIKDGIAMIDKALATSASQG